MKTIKTLFDGQMKLKNDEYEIAYEFPEACYMLTYYEASDIDSVYENIMQVVD